MRLQSIIKYVSRFLEPTRVFIALMLAVGMWLFPFISFEKQTTVPIEHGVIISAVPFTAGAIGECSNVRCDPGYCCQFGYCVIKNKAECGQDDPPPPSPPSIGASLNCSNWGDNGWCKGSLSIDLSAADPQGQAVVISGAVNGNNFACPSGATSCSIPLSGEGTGSVSYQVNSATGLSAAGSLGYQIDLSSPDLNASVSGAAGTNGWYRSDVTLSVSASDATSGIASITASINGGGATSVGGSLTFSDGEYSVLIVARDNAGHVTQDTQIIKVDTITPSLSFTSSGTNGKNGWYVSSASAAATASDSGSGLASIEASVDGGAWTGSDSISLSDGVHTYQFRATDVAGNKTETPTQTALIDTIAPSISMSQGTSLGEKVLYEIEDYGSGLSIFRAVIEDDDEAYQKVTWSGDISGSYIADDILWDGKFADGARAGIGEYMVTLKITDAAGNKAMKTTFVTVGLLDLLDDIPAFSPPISSTSEEDEIPTTASSTGPQTFGGIPTTTNAGEFISTTTTVSGITIPTTNIPIDPNILWGAAASAMVGATLADWQKKREEEARRKAEAQEEKRANTEKRWAQKKAEDAVRDRWNEDAKRERANNASTARWEGLAKQEEAKQQARINDANAARWAGLAAMEQKKEEAKKAQEQAAFDHRMGEHTGEQDKVDAWYDQQHRLSEHQQLVQTPWWIPQYTRDQAYQFASSLPTLTILEGRHVTPIFQIPFANLITIGTVVDYSNSVKLNPELSLSPKDITGISPDIQTGDTSASFESSLTEITMSTTLDKLTAKFSLNHKEPAIGLSLGIKAPLDSSETPYEAKAGYSLKVMFKFNNFYNSTIGVDLYGSDVDITNPATTSNEKTGVSLEMNTWAAVAVVAVILYSSEIAALLSALGLGASSLLKMPRFPLPSW